ncbi:MAG TPA: hypothetical protein VFL82_03610 [Thermomicrobiales bacterium]|nr:hypothetical protein [Thermomicrobiales bacterium]
MATARVVITDLTRMSGSRICVAGYRRLEDGSLSCIRPLFRHGHLEEHWAVLNHRIVIEPFAVVELDLLFARPELPHSEDWFIRPSYRLRKGQLSDTGRWSLCEQIADDSVASIFGTDILVNGGWFVKRGQGSRSLGTIRASIEQVEYQVRPGGNGWDYRLTFNDGHDSYRLAVTDLAFRYYLDDLRDGVGLSPHQAATQLARELAIADQVWLRIGLARGWDRHPDRCYLQITGVYSSPDYLGGRCFADFRMPESPDPLDLAAVPF